MKSDSKYFDMIRIKGASKKPGKAAQVSLPNCQWKGCDQPGRHKAPKGRGHENEFLNFCAKHVRQYNASYNYFEGMSDSEISEFQKNSAYGDRPTWKVGANSWAQGTRKEMTEEERQKFSEARRASAKRAQAKRAKAKTSKRKLKPLEKKSFLALELKESATSDDIKAQYKLLVKRHHPDANGGDRGSEEKLREIIQAYNYLKQVGLVT